MKQDKVIVLGHKNPDTDSILAAILVAFYSKKIFGFQAEARRAGELNGETKFVLNSLPKSAGIKLPKMLDKIGSEKVIMVDTTEPSQIVDGLNENNLRAIIDHHNLGGLKSSQAVYTRVEPLGSSCSVLYKILEEKNIKPNRYAAMLMIASIISDTLSFTSPTTTVEDKAIAKELNKVAKLDIKKFAQDMFEAKSSLKGVKEEDIVQKDYKFYQMGKNKIGISVWETVNPASVEEKRVRIFAVLEEKKKKEELDYLFFGVVDIIRQNTQLYLIGEAEEKLAKDVFREKSGGKSMVLKGVVSRKKQLVPPLMKKLS